MKFTLGWLKDHLETKESLADLMHHLTMLGIEVESFDDPSPRLAPFLIAEIKRIEKHPNADRLNICYVQISANVREPLIQVVCGAPNVYEGMKTVFAHIGTYIPGLQVTLKQGNIRNIQSNGMLCSLNELGLGSDQGGIVDLPKDALTGHPFAKTFGHDDPVIEVSVTPNRSDCLGVIGIARDIAAAGFGKYIPRKTPTLKGSYPCPKSISIESFDDCSVYMGRIIRNVKNAESPLWLQQRLRRIGLEPISAIVDITNYISYDLCRPLHAFDADMLTDKISVRRAKEKETIVGLNDREYALTPQHLVIADEKGPVAIAGVLGGKVSGTTMNTVNVFIESAFFHPNAVTISGRNLNIHTDSRMRFERGVDPEAIRIGLDRATQMILEICGGEASDVAVAGIVPTNLKEIKLSLDKVKLLTGVSIPAKTIEKYLGGLGFTNIHHIPGDALKMTTPSWRFDLSNEHDVIEEIIRIHGYDTLSTQQLSLTPGFKPLSFSQSIPLVSKKIMASLGFNECIHYSFINEKAANHFRKNDNLIEIENPISQNFSYMRSSVLPSLLETVQRNLAYQHNSLRLFEVGPTYQFGQDRHTQETVVGAVLTGLESKKNWRQSEKEYTAFDIKAEVLQLIEHLGVKVETLQLDIQEVPAWYHPGQSAALKLGPKLTLGYLGRIHPSTEKLFDINQPVYGFELFLDRLPLKPFKYKAYQPNFLQHVERDFAFTIGADIPASVVVKAVSSAEKEYITNISIFDVYSGKGIPEGKKSIAFSVTFAPKESTFTDERLHELSQKVISAVVKATGGELRGA